MASIWTLRLNVGLGSLVVAVGAWLAWDQLSIPGTGLVMASLAAFLLWRGHTTGLVWAWSTLLLGIECFAWPITTMVRIQSAAAQPSDEQMGTILSAVLMGLFSAVFWIAFSYGLFKRAKGEQSVPLPESAGKSLRQSPPTAPTRPRKKR